MYRYKYIILYLCATLLLSSCSKTIHFGVIGNPGTRILNPSGECLATLDSKGTATVKIPRNMWYAYAIAQDPSQNTLIPFAIDYKRSSKGLLPKYILGVIGAAPSLGVSALCVVNYGENLDVVGQYALRKHQVTNQDVIFRPVKFETFSSDAPEPSDTTVHSVNGKDKTAKSKKKAVIPPEEFFTHTVAKGETLKSIAEIYDVRPRDIIKWNKMSKSTLSVGQKLKIKIP